MPQKNSVRLTAPHTPPELDSHISTKQKTIHSHLALSAKKSTTQPTPSPYTALRSAEEKPGRPKRRRQGRPHSQKVSSKSIGIHGKPTASRQNKRCKKKMKQHAQELSLLLGRIQYMSAALQRIRDQVERDAQEVDIIADSETLDRATADAYRACSARLQNIAYFFNKEFPEIFDETEY